ncbi:MAG: hypothetical protein JSW00_00390 [Thermoplasmata archaeon]|nr:MAG: hypothetical protein JSW00_00390 [Thermoplasmata archaeon]
MYDSIIWIGVIIFIALIIASVLFYFQNEKFDTKYKKNIEIIRAIKAQKLKDFGMKYFEEEALEVKAKSKKEVPSGEDFKDLGKKALRSGKNLNRLTKKAADLKMWYDYQPRAKDFLVSAALWTFLLGLISLVICLSIWAELNNAGEIRYSGYLSFIWIIMAINLFKNILRYNIVTTNINKHMDMIREGDVEKF